MHSAQERFGRIYAKCLGTALSGVVQPRYRNDGSGHMR